MDIRAVVFLIICLFAIRYKGISQDRKFVEWDKPLGFEYFKGPIPREDTAAARVSVSIGLQEWSNGKNVLSFSAGALMYPAESWVKSDYKNDSTLFHEQGHFDIAEIYARKLYLALKKKGYKTSESASVEKLYDVFLMQMNTAQLLYDKETNGGLNSAKQQAWKEKIKQELSLLPKSPRHNN